MTDMSDRDPDRPFPLTPQEEAAMKALPRGIEPPAALEDRVVAELKARGLLRTGSGRRRAAWLGGAAAAAALFVAGLAVGQRVTVPSGADALSSPQFVLFLYEDDAYLAPDPADAGRRVEEYREWAMGLAARGVLTGGEKLKDEARLVAWDSPDEAQPGDREPPGPGALTGYFIVTAPGVDEAAAIAADCPHIKYRGRVLVREIDPV